jgi:NAD dependent epimerase/dehydratase family enzyme
VAGVITTGQRVLPGRALELGYQFQYPDLDAALRQLLQAKPAAAGDSNPGSDG